MTDKEKAEETQLAVATDIHQAINLIMSEVGYVQKESAEKLNYTFAGEAALIRALRPVMVKHGVTVAVIGGELEGRDTYTTKSGTVMNSTLLRSTVRFTHAPSNTFVDVVAFGEGSDAGDKSGNKAMTGAYKYALRQTFCIETGDDPDKDPSSDQERAAPAIAKTQRGLIQYGQALGLTKEQVGEALSAAKIKKFNTSIWNEMVEAVDAFAGNGSA